MGAQRKDFADSTPLDDPAQEAERTARLAEQWKEVARNEGLVCYFAERYQATTRLILHLDDLKSAGRLGALKAVQRRDFSMKPYQWRRYLAFGIRRAIQDHISSQAVPIKLPSIENRKRMERDYQDQPALAAVRTILDHPVLNIFFDQDAPRDERPGPVERVLEREERFTVRSAVADLPGPEREIIESSFGLGRDPCSDQALAARNGISPWRIQNQKRRALRQLRHSLISRV